MDDRASLFRQAECVGRWDLFDSVEPRDHSAARALCATCPAIEECRAEVTDLTDGRGAPLGPTGNPDMVRLRGTWAGVLFGKRGRRPISVAG